LKIFEELLPVPSDSKTMFFDMDAPRALHRLVRNCGQRKAQSKREQV
jgi:hypothetical protein